MTRLILFFSSITTNYFRLERDKELNYKAFPPFIPPPASTITVFGI